MTLFCSQCFIFEKDVILNPKIIKTNAIKYLFGLSISIITVCCETVNQEDYTATILEERRGKDGFMQKNEASPFLKTGTIYRGLNYFDVDSDYRVNAKIDFLPEPSNMTFKTSTGQIKTYLKIAKLTFEISQKTQHLFVYKALNDTHNDPFYIPFSDLTTGKETYGAGRYLDIEPPKKGNSTIWIDFNMAYNPYCAYTDGYSCPIPLQENSLGVPINAGEKKYDKSH